MRSRILPAATLLAMSCIACAPSTPQPGGTLGPGDLGPAGSGGAGGTGGAGGAGGKGGAGGSAACPPAIPNQASPCSILGACCTFGTTYCLCSDQGGATPVWDCTVPPGCP